jgi:hypothetical protein
MNPTETDLNLLDVGSDVDIEALMERIRQHVSWNPSAGASIANSSSALTDNPLGNALVSQAAFNRAIVETLGRICVELQRQVARQDAQAAELQAHHAHLRETLQQLQHNLARVSDNEALLHREFINHVEMEFQQVTAQLAIMDDLFDMVRQETRTQPAPRFGATNAERK